MLNFNLENKNNSLDLKIKGSIVEEKHGSRVGIVISGEDDKDYFNVMVLKALHDDGVLTYYYDECVDFGQIVEDFDIIRLENQYVLEIKDL